MWFSMQGFKIFKILVIFKLSQIFRVLQTYPLKIYLVLEDRADPRIDREIPF